MRIYQTVWEAVSYRGLFTADWFGVREKHCSQVEIYDRLRTSKHADSHRFVCVWQLQQQNHQRVACGLVGTKREIM